MSIFQWISKTMKKQDVVGSKIRENQPWNNISDSLAWFHEFVLGHAVSIMTSRPLTGCNTLGSRGGGMFRSIFQPFYHFSLNGSSHRGMRSTTQIFGRSFQSLLTFGVIWIWGALLGRLNHSGRGIGQLFGSSQETPLLFKKKGKEKVNLKNFARNKGAFYVFYLIFFFSLCIDR